MQSKKLAKLIEIYETTEDICCIIIHRKISTVFLVSHFSITFLAAKEFIYIYIYIYMQNYLQFIFFKSEDITGCVKCIVLSILFSRGT